MRTISKLKFAKNSLMIFMLDWGNARMLLIPYLYISYYHLSPETVWNNHFPKVLQIKTYYSMQIPNISNIFQNAIQNTLERLMIYFNDSNYCGLLKGLFSRFFKMRDLGQWFIYLSGIQACLRSMRLQAQSRVPK